MALELAEVVQLNVLVHIDLRTIATEGECDGHRGQRVVADELFGEGIGIVGIAESQGVSG